MNTIVGPYAEYDYVIGLLWAVFLGLTLLFWPVSKVEREGLLIAWGAKIAVALGLALIYENYYPLDAFGWFNSSILDPTSFSDLEFGDGTTVMYWLTSVHNYVAPPCYNAQKITWTYLGLLGIYLFYAAARTYLRSPPSKKMLLVFALFPSVIFWSSTLGKDPLALVAVALFVYSVVKWQVERNTLYILLAAGGVFIASAIRGWLGAILLTPLAVLASMRIRSMRTSGVIILAIAVFLPIVYQLLADRLQIDSAEQMLERADGMAHAWSEGGSGRELSLDIARPSNLILFLPLGMFTALFRPLPGEVLNVFGFFAGIENAFSLWMLIRAVRRTRLAELRDPLIAWALATVLIWSAAYGIVSYQNLGTAVRFRLQIQPLLLGLLVYLGRDRSRSLSMEPVPPAPEPPMRFGQRRFA